MNKNALHKMNIVDSSSQAVIKPSGIYILECYNYIESQRLPSIPLAKWQKTGIIVSLYYQGIKLSYQTISGFELNED
jgi:hypothetical protein